MSEHKGSISHWRRAALVTTAVVAAGVVAAVPLAGSSGGSGSDADSTSMKPSGVYALSNEQLAYYAGFRAGQGNPLEIDAAWELSEAELAFLSRPTPTAADAADR
jgi:hypothetical protein